MPRDYPCHAASHTEIDGFRWVLTGQDGRPNTQFLE